MRKQVIITTKGEFNPIEFKNLIQFKVKTYNLEHKDPKHPDITGRIELISDNTMRTTLEGEEEDIAHIAKVAERGPVIAHITEATTEWNQYSKRFSRFSITRAGKPEKKRSRPKKKRRRRFGDRNIKKT